MPSDAERGAYGEGKKIPNWELYNPLGHKITPFPEEQPCALCDSTADVLFPIKMNLCPKCAQSVIERKDIFKRFKSFTRLSGMKCDKCGEGNIQIYEVSTRICNKCTYKLGRQLKKRREAQKFARKVI